MLVSSPVTTAISMLRKPYDLNSRGDLDMKSRITLFDFRASALPLCACLTASGAYHDRPKSAVLGESHVRTRLGLPRTYSGGTVFLMFGDYALLLGSGMTKVLPIEYASAS
eukprot:6179876-Pleurochrysis_carterae.AAC.6